MRNTLFENMELRTWLKEVKKQSNIFHHFFKSNNTSGITSAPGFLEVSGFKLLQVFYFCHSLMGFYLFKVNKKETKKSLHGHITAVSDQWGPSNMGGVNNDN